MVSDLLAALSRNQVVLQCMNRLGLRLNITRQNTLFRLPILSYNFFKRVIVTPAVYPRLVEFLHFDIQSTGQKSHCVNILWDHHNALF